MDYVVVAIVSFARIFLRITTVRLLIVILIFFSLRAAGDVWFVPGWRTGFDDRIGCVYILRDNYPGKKIKVCSWDSLQPWRVTRTNAKEFANLLFA